MVQGILILLVFVAVAALMMTKKIPTLLATDGHFDLCHRRRSNVWKRRRRKRNWLADISI